VLGHIWSVWQGAVECVELHKGLLDELAA